MQVGDDGEKQKLKDCGSVFYQVEQVVVNVKSTCNPQKLLP